MAKTPRPRGSLAHPATLAHSPALCTLAVVAIMLIGLTSAQAARIDLLIDPGPGPVELTLRWGSTAGTGPYAIHRSADVTMMQDPSTIVTELFGLFWIDTAPPSALVYYNVLETPCTASLCEDGFGCTIDSCNPSGGCLHDIVAGSCLVDGVCFLDDENDPGESCRYCDAGVDQTAWTGRPLGTVCGGGDNPCVDIVCDGAGSCAAPPPNYNECDDGDPATVVDFCYLGECQGFQRNVIDSATSTVPYAAATPAAGNAVHAVFGETLGGPIPRTNILVDRFDIDVTPVSTTLLELGVPAFPGPALSNNVFVQDTPMWELLSGGTWSSTTDLSDAWAAAAPVGRFSAVTTFTDVALSRSSLLAAGWDSTGGVMVVQRCNRDFVCFPDPCTWGCGAQSVVPVFAQNERECVGFGTVDASIVVACNFFASGAADASFTDLLRFDFGSSQWTLLAGLPVSGGKRLRAVAQVNGNQILGVGDDGLMFLGTGAGGSVLFEPITLPVGTAVDFTAAALYDGQVWVTGVRELIVRELFLLRAPLGADLTDAASWRLRTVETLDPLSCHDARLTAIAGSGPALYLFGAWCDGDPADAERALWRFLQP